MDGSNERRIVLLGKTGSGKSSLGNTILGDSLLKVKPSPESETSECQAETKTVDNMSTTVIDTPGFFDTKMSEEELKLEVVKSLVECAPGPHAFLIVLQLGRYSDQEKEVINKILECFSEEALKHAVIVFTHGDQLPKGMKIEEFVSKSKDLNNLVKRCGGRCHIFDNKYWNNNNHGDYRSNQHQVKQLLNTIDKMRNSRGCYTNEMLEEVEKEKKKNPEGVVGRLLKRFLYITAGALLGIFFGVFKFPLNPVLGVVIGGVIGGAAGYYTESKSMALPDVVETTIDMLKKNI